VKQLGLNDYWGGVGGIGNWSASGIERGPNGRACLVSFTDAQGIHHSAEVTASSLYEAGSAWLSFKGCGLMDSQPGHATRLTVTVGSPTTRHEVAMATLEWWLSGDAKSPNEQVMRNRLREISGIVERNINDSHLTALAYCVGSSPSTGSAS
jgi:hypothetical protein